jgi:hypothetical protein
VKITKEHLWSVETYFDGIISATLSDLYNTTIICKDKLHLLERRNLVNNYSINASISSILSTILTDINALDNTWMTLDCSVSTIKNVSYTKDQNFLQVLRDITNWIEFKANDSVIQVATTIGSDISSETEFRFDVLNIWDRNIAGVSVEDDSKNLANAVSVKGTTTTVTSDPTSITTYGRIDGSFSVDWDSASEAPTILAEHKDWGRNITIQPIEKDFFIADIGDTVAINVITECDLVYFTGTMRIIEKRLNWGDADRMQYVLWNNKLKTKNFLEKQNEIDERLKKIELS